MPLLLSWVAMEASPALADVQQQQQCGLAAAISCRPPRMLLAQPAHPGWRMHEARSATTRQRTRPTGACMPGAGTITPTQPARLASTPGQSVAWPT